ncbi:MAG: SDR family NAD(P)-dependent oxidoreductase [Candidatus Woesearchaeota archaeon]
MKKLALITGASSGLGREITKELALQGFDTIASARREELLRELAGSINGGSYKTFSGTDIKSVLELANHTTQRFFDGNYNSLTVVAAADMHEKAVVEENGKKRYTTRQDFSEEYIRNSRMLSVVSPMLLYASLAPKVSNLNFLYVSSQAANKDFWSKGNSIYGRNKRSAEQSFEDFKDVYSLRFGFIDTEMAEDLLKQLEGIEPFVHIDNDLTKPLKPKEELFLPVKKVAQDIVGFVDNKNDFEKVYSNVYSYNAKPSKELYQKYK